MKKWHCQRFMTVHWAVFPMVEGVDHDSSPSSNYVLGSMYMYAMLCIYCSPQKLKFKYFTDNKMKPQLQNGLFKAQCTTAAGKNFSLNNLLYIDDGTFILTKWDKLQQSAQIIHDTLAHFNLQMHIGSSSQKSKTKEKVLPQLPEWSKKQHLPPTTKHPPQWWM